jgi:fructose transport system ATP-binding protein
MKREAQQNAEQVPLPSIDSAVEDLSGGQSRVAVARSAIFARRLVIMDEPTAASASASPEKC